MTITLAAAGAGLAALSPLSGAEETPSLDAFLQQHYKRLTVAEKKRFLPTWKPKSTPLTALRPPSQIRRPWTAWSLPMH